MSAAFQQVIATDRQGRLDLFLATSGRLGTTVQNVEKDFWVCWILDALFNGMAKGGPRLLFKGGTSLSKGFGLIERFSEDIDITVFREDLGEGASVEDLEALSSNRRQAKLEAIKAKCQTYISGPLTEELRGVIRHAMEAAAIAAGTFSLESDPDDPDGQSLLFRYPAVTEGDPYVLPAVKIESGAKSALDPHVDVVVRPYVDEDAPGLDLRVTNVTTVVPERTFWDKVVILHGLRQWYDGRGELRHGGQRVSRHYYDVFWLLNTKESAGWVADRGLAADCVRHARLFFDRPALGLSQAAPGSFTLVPTDPMREALARDYDAMKGMVFGPVPALDEVLLRVAELEKQLNS